MTENYDMSVAVIGCGYWGKNLVRDFNGLGALKAIHDPHAETANRLSVEHGVPVRTIDEILGDGEIDGIVIAAPAELHAEIAIRGFEAGKHVFVEKPISLSLSDAEKMIAASDKAGKILMVGHLLQYHPIFLKLKELVRAGELGKIRYIYSRRLSLGKLRTEENVLWSFSPHDISMILALAGEEPNQVQGFNGNFLQDDISDFASIQMKFGNGIRAHIEASWLNPFKEQRMVVVGDKAMAEFLDSAPDWNEKLKIYRHTAEINDGVPNVAKAEAENIVVEAGNPLVNECEHFLRFMANNETPFTDGREALGVLKVLHAGDTAAQG